jgi:hypothetical protein
MTHLSIDQAEERRILHRDLISHTLRWTHVAKFMHAHGAYKDARVLDVGCGRDVPLARMLYSNRLLVKEYVGVDYNASEKFDKSMFDNGRFNVHTFGKVDFASNQVWFDKDVDDNHVMNIRGDNAEDYFRMPNIITCFEVFEHVEPAHGKAMLLRFAETMRLSAENGLAPILFLSTPVWNVSDCAANHVSEIKHAALGWLIEECGLEVQKMYGTFASIRDYRDKMFTEYPGSKAIYDILAGYYDTNMLANVFAPLYPADSRNCLWRITLPTGKPRQFDGPVPPCAEPWTSSERWSDLTSTLEGLYDPTNTGVGRIER